MVYTIFNATDGFVATDKTFYKVHTAEKEVQRIRNSIRKNQGYYRDNRWNKIDPDDVQYQVIDREDTMIVFHEWFKKQTVC